MKKDKSMPEDFDEVLKRILEYKPKKRRKDEKRT